MRLCAVEGCGFEHCAKGFCQKHYLRWKKHGDPMIRRRAVESIFRSTAGSPISPLWRPSAGPLDTSCWLWRRASKAAGYGHLLAAGTYEGAHRFAYRLANGDIPAGMDVCHRCDVPACVNPEHLFIGSRADNEADKAWKGRTPRGEKVGTAKLNEDSIREIRRLAALGLTQQKIADAFGVARSRVSYIVNRKHWAHVGSGFPAQKPTWGSPPAVFQNAKGGAGGVADGIPR